MPHPLNAQQRAFMRYLNIMHVIYRRNRYNGEAETTDLVLRDNIKVDVKEIGCEVVDSVLLA